jgi:hypothetical protein
VSLTLTIVSLLLSSWEIWILVAALNAHFRAMQRGKGLPSRALKKR